MKRGSIITLVVLILIVLVVAVYVYQVRTRPIDVESSTVKKGVVEDTVSASGKIEANRLIPIMSPVADKVVGILVKEGDTVEQDQELIDLDRVSSIESPIAGVVVKIDVQVDQTVAPGTPVVTVADMNPTYAIVNVDETDIAKIKVGQATRINLDSYPQAQVSGEVSEIGLVATQTAAGGTAFPVKIKVTSTGGAVLRVGMSADADMVLATYPEATVAPVEAVATRDGKDVVFVLKDSTVEMKEVKLGLLSGDLYEVKEGLSVGDKIATTNVDKLSSGASVRVTKTVD